MIIKIYGNTNTGVLLFTGQIWRTELTERMMSYVMERETKLPESTFHKHPFFPRKSTFSGAGLAKDWKIKPVDI